MKKKIFYRLLFLAVAIIIIPVTAHAECTPYAGNPYFYQVAPDVKTRTYPLKTNQDACMGNFTSVYFSAFRTFPESYPYLDAKFNVWLYEEDPPGNDDELVKKYIFRVLNRVITEAYLLSTVTPGKIDSAGDQTCELYLQIGGLTGQCCNIPMQKTVFDYKICMD